MLLATPCAAQAAPAGNVEVISRAWGVDGASPYTLPSGLTAGVVSDNGRYAAFSVARDGELPTNGPSGFVSVPVPLYLRDVLLNRTYEIASTGYSVATGIDRSGRYISYEQTPGVDLTRPAASMLYLYDTRTHTRRLVGRASGIAGAAATTARGMVTGDGKSVVFLAEDVPGLGSGLFRRSLATSITTRIGARPVQELNEPRITSVSDDGKRVALTTFAMDEPDHGLLVTPQRTITFDGTPYLSADGSTAAYTRRGDEGAAALVSIDAATGAKTNLPAPKAGIANDRPASWYDVAVAWVSPNGRDIGVLPRTLPNGLGSSEPSSRFFAQVLDRETSQWRPAGVFAESLSRYPMGPFQFGAAAVSRNGRFSVFVPYRGGGSLNGDARGLVIADNTGQQGIPGGVDLPSANFYVNRSDLQCPYGPTIDRFTAVTAPKYLPKAESIRGVVRFGNAVALDGTVTSDESADVVVPAEATSITIDVTVTFPGGGRSVGTYTWPLSAVRCKA